MKPGSAYDYRSSFANHLIRWADVPVGELPILEINQHLNNLQLEKAYAANHASSVAGAVEGLNDWAGGKIDIVGRRGSFTGKRFLRKSFDVAKFFSSGLRPDCSLAEKQGFIQSNV